MIVLDASAAYELLVRSRVGGSVERRILEDPEVRAPELIYVEVASAIRRRTLAGSLDGRHGSQLIAELALLPLTSHGHGDLVGRIWQLRQHVTSYDAAYVALAEALDATLITTDARLAGAPGHGATIELLAA